MNFRNSPMYFRSLATLAGLFLVSTSAAYAQSPAAPVNLRCRFTPGQTLRYLIQRAFHFADPAGAIEMTNSLTPYRPPVVERLTEKVQAVDRDGTATVQVTIAPEVGFEDEANPQPPVTRTVRVTSLGQVLTPVSDPATRELLRAFFQLPTAPVQLGETWKGTAFRGTDKVETSLALAAVRNVGKGLAIITQTLPPTVTQSRSPDHDGVLLQTTRTAQADRIVFDMGEGNLRRQVSTQTVLLSLVMTERGARGAADFGHVIPNMQVIQTMTIDRQEDSLAFPPAASSPVLTSPTSIGRRSKS